MHKTNLYIPKKIKVGFQERSETFTGKLAYVVYFDEKGVLRKETSWEGWRDKNIEPLEFDNEPRSGFIFNKGVQRYGYWGSGRSVIRVYDPRDFEFEISVDNLIGLLMHSDVSKRDIVEECVFAWSGKDLVLLPTNSEEYKQSVEYTEKQSKKISAKELVKGYSYAKKKSDETFIYVGYFDWYEFGYDNSWRVHKNMGKKHVFYNESSKTFETPSVSTFSSVISEEVHSEYPIIVDSFFKTINSQKIVDVEISSDPIEGSHYYLMLYRKKSEKQLEGLQFYYSRVPTERDIEYIENNISNYIYDFKDDRFMESNSRNSHRYGYYDKPTRTGLSKEIFDKISDLGYNIEEMTKEQIVEILSSLGFGYLNYVLENQNKAKS